MAAVLMAGALILAGVDGCGWESTRVRQFETENMAAATAPARRVQTTVQVAEPPPTPPSYPSVTGPCAEWAELAFEVGWPVEQWPTISRVMWCESKCQPWARNPSGASGLMQVMPFHWHGRDPFDPASNLTMALEVHERQGWRAWSCF